MSYAIFRANFTHSNSISDMSNSHRTDERPHGLLERSVNSRVGLQFRFRRPIVRVDDFDFAWHDTLVIHSHVSFPVRRKAPQSLNDRRGVGRCNLRSKQFPDEFD